MKLERIEGVFDGESFEFENDKFSTFTVVYQDVEDEPEEDEEGTEEETKETEEGTESETEAAPETGVFTNEDGGATEGRVRVGIVMIAPVVIMYGIRLVVFGFRNLKRNKNLA